MSGGGVLLSSASGILSLLEEPDQTLQQYALTQLNQLVEQFWPEIATVIPKIETLYEDEKFKSRDLAAVVASKVFYHLEELDDALKYALGAGSLFDINTKNEYVETLVAKCIDEYIRLRTIEYEQEHHSTLTRHTSLTGIEQKDNTADDHQQDSHTSTHTQQNNVQDHHSSSPPAPPIDSRLVDVVERMFRRCYADGQYHQALGIAIEARRLDQVKASITQSSEQKAMLSYAYQLSQSLVLTHHFRHALLQTLVELYTTLSTPDYLNVCQCLLFLNDHIQVADILNSLILHDADEDEDNNPRFTQNGSSNTSNGSNRAQPTLGANGVNINSYQYKILMAYQIAFDLGENQNQAFLNRVAQTLTKLAKERTQTTSTTATTDTATPSTTTTASSTTTEEKTATDTTSTAESSAVPMDISSPADASSSSTTDATVVDTDAAHADTYPNRVSKLLSILSGTLTTSQYLHFLYEHNHTDLNILKQIKDKLEPRNSVTHNATVMTHGLLHCGTTVDVFLRDNLEWLGKAQNWAKFTATASIGVIHKGHIAESLKLLEPYLPTGTAGTGSPYQEGGALYALGLVHSSHGAEKIDYLNEALRNAGNNEIVQHGACLGLGLCAMATGNDALFDGLKNVVMSESAVAGEAAGYAMGLVLLGSGNGVAIEEMLAYAHDTQHEKIIRGLSMGIAMINYGREEEADVVIEQLLLDKDPILRYGGMYAIGLAYACTANNAAIQKLLHVAVSDVSDDVRRAAVTCLGFVLANLPEQVPRVVSLLAESYNPHVRFGSALAIGIACAAGLTEKIRKEALAVLEPLLKDRVDFVRQGAFIGMAMVCIQHNEASEPKVALLRNSINDAMNIKSDTMTKFGAILAAGIVDAGGRNVTISLLSSSAHKKMAAIVGLALFPQFWYWYPLVHFLSLAFTPTAIIGLNKNLDIPQGFTFVSRAPASVYAYPPPIELKKAEEKKEVKHVTLSVTAKAKAKAKRKEDEKKGASTSTTEEDTKMADIQDNATLAATTAADTTTTTTAAEASPKPTTTEEKEDVTMPPATATEEPTPATAAAATSAPSSAAATEASPTTATSPPTTAAAEDKHKKPAAPELPFHILTNPARITLPQLSTLIVPKQQRYVPVKSQLSGIVLLADTQPQQAEQLVKGKTPKIGIPGVSDDEPEPPKPFEYTGP